MPCDLSAELQEVLSHYDLGRLVHQAKDERGTVNISFFVDTIQDGQPRKFFLRRYKRGVQAEELLFEHSLINHIVRQRACPAARVHPTRDGRTFLHLHRPDEAEGAFYAVFDYLPGEDRYTWVGPRCTRPELLGAGRLLARFHNAVSSLEPQGKRVEPKTLELLEVIDGLWVDGRRRPKGTDFDSYLDAHFDLVRQNIAETLDALREPKARALPQVIIHSDYHPGNLKFEGEEISGLVDFDWAKVDLRAFDVGLALWYFCVSWEAEVDGELRLEDARVFLEAYQRQLLGGPGYPPLSPAEIRYLPDLISAGNIYVIYWTIRDYFNKDVDPEEYLVYLKHHVASARWLGRRENRDGLRAMLASLPMLNGAR
jgi:homoserine kinase type II